MGDDCLRVVSPIVLGVWREELFFLKLLYDSFHGHLDLDGGSRRSNQIHT